MVRCTSVWPAAAVLCVLISIAGTRAPARASDDTPAAAVADPHKAYQQTLGDWKALLKQMRVMRLQRQTAEPSEVRTLTQQWEALVRKGNELLPKLRAEGLAVFQAEPNADAELNRFLVRLLEEEVNDDRYEEALELGRALVEGKCNVPIVYPLTGVAAFSVHEFDLARHCFETARDNGQLSEEHQRLLANLDEVEQMWEQEQQLREADANSNLPRVKLTTSQGDIVLELFEDQAPETVGNFVHLVEEKFYDGLTFHRVLPGFMAQTGCPLGTGAGGPGYSIFCETGRTDRRNHFRGSLSMAKQPLPNTGGSQFFLCFSPRPYLNGEHTVFGRIIEGMEVLARLQRRDPEKASPPEPDKIVKAEVLRKREHEYVPHKVPR